MSRPSHPTRAGSTPGAVLFAVLSAALTIALTVAQPCSSQAPAIGAADALLVKAAKVLPMDGPPIDRGEVLIAGGRIVAVGRGLETPAGTTVRELPDGFVVPGFVELHCHVGVDGGINDSALPHNMDLRTLDLILQDSPELEDAVSAGVTTALIIPGSGSTIGGLGVLVKTAGRSFERRLIRHPGALKVALFARGGNPSRAGGELGATRLGLHHMLREVMEEARDYHVAWTRFENGDGPRPTHSARLDPLRGLFRREFPIILHAYGQNDTMTAIRMLHWRLELPIVISHGVYDSFKIAEQLAITGVPMNIGPRQYEFYESRFQGNAVALERAGVPVSICTDAPVVAQDQLPLQAAMAARLGLPDHAALRGLTIEPAKAIGIAHRTGSITPGKDADLCVFDGDPLDPRNPPRLVLVDGFLAVDNE